MTKRNIKGLNKCTESDLLLILIRHPVVQLFLSIFLYELYTIHKTNKGNIVFTK